MPLSYYWSLLRRYRWKIVTFVLLVTVAVTLLALALPKEYQSTVVIRVDPQGMNVVGDNSVRSSGADTATMLATTEAEVIKSPAVVLQTIKTLHLDRDPEFAGARATSGNVTTNEGLNDVLRKVTKQIDVTVPPGTLLLQVSFHSHFPQLSANVANGLAQSFLEHEYQTRAHALTDASRYMLDQVDALRAKMEQDQAALINYESSHDVLDPDDKNNIYQARLSQINQDLSAAQSARIRLEAENQIASSKTLDSLLTTSLGQALVPLQQRLIADQRSLAKLGTIYGPRHPLYRQQEKVVDHDRSVLSSQEKQVAAEIHNLYRTALARETLIGGALNREKTAVDDFNRRTIRYHALKAAADSSTKLYNDLQQHIQDATVAAGLRSEDLRITSPALPADKPVFPRPLLMAVLAFFASTITSVGAALIAGMADKTITSPEQVELRFSVPAIATLPQISLHQDPGALRLQIYGTHAPQADKAKNQASRSSYQEAILSLHSAIQFSGGDRIRTLAITSSLPGEGKSTASCHLAAASAALGQRTVLVDADMRKPNVHRLFGISNQVGLSSLLQEKTTLGNATVEASPGLTIIPAGPSVASPSELLHVGLNAIIDQLRDQFDVIIIDCPPVLGFNDAPTVASLADGVLLVVAAGATDQQLIGASLRNLRRVRAAIMGVVLNRVSEQLDSYYGYYNKYYSEYYTANDEGQDENVED